jgi:hypothetical protein
LSDLQLLLSEPVGATHQTSESFGVKVAAAVVPLVNAKEQAPLEDWPVHAAPPQAYNSVPVPCTELLAVEGDAVAVNVTGVPLANAKVQVPGQDMPAGLEVTVPLPVTDTVNDAPPPDDPPPLLPVLLLPPLPPQPAREKIDIKVASPSKPFQLRRRPSVVFQIADMVFIF